MDERLAAALDAAFTDREVTELGSTGPSWNDHNRTVRVEFADGRAAYLKYATDGDGSRVARERAVLEYVGANSEVPVPTVLASDADGTPLERGDGAVPYLSTAPVRGANLLDRWSGASPDERAALAWEVGAALAGVHERRFDGHGHVVGGGAGGLELRTGPWTGVLVDKIGEMRAMAPADRFDHHFDEVAAAVEANRDLLDDAPAALLHGDTAQPNCFRGESGVGFLDWEIAHVGDPARDLHRACDQQFGSLRGDAPEELTSALYEGYRERAGGLPDGYEDRRPVYEAVRFLGTSGYVEKVAEYADEPVEELAAWVDEEMDRRLAAIR
ncbi:MULTISPECIES: phosphotransferase family protein [Halorussus]|uniref:phosphotransferase family protein n=1 Tax=Halorussus TaxID=1070314 RepID=UPI00209DC264|nr:phosphotransferase [Halorussus vallis]USZ76220.1 phosphotransferase [Halorussus vallis]